MRRLGYYTPQFPFPQGPSAGPYPRFIGRSRVALVMVGAPACGGCGCKHKRRRGFRLGDDTIPTYDATPLTPQQMQVAYATPNVSVDTTGTYSYGDLAAPSGPVDSYGNPVDLTNAPSLPAIQSPPGSQLLYQVSWSASLAHPLTGSSQAVAAFTQQLPGSGMSVVSSNVTSPPVLGGITGYSAKFLINDNVGHALLTDAQGVCDALMRSIVGGNLSGSSISLSSGLPFNLTSFLEQNWPLLALGTVGAIILVKVM